MRFLRGIPLAFCLLGACYRYAPIVSSAPPTGSEFRARLTDEGSVRLTPTLGAQIALVEGRVSSANDSAYVVSVSATTNRSQVQTFWTGESVTLPRTSIQAIEARTLDRKKTWVIATLGLVGGVLAAKIFDLFGGSAGGDGGGGGGPPPP
jgi:hypothetical protein